MSTSHTRSVFANNCLCTPRKILSTRFPSTSHHDPEECRSPFKPEDPLMLSLTPSTPYVWSLTSPVKEPHPSTVEGNERPQEEEEERKEYATLFSTLLESNALLLDEIRALKNEHQHPEGPTEEERLCQSLPPKLLKDTWVIPSDGASPSFTGSLSDDEGSEWSEVVEDIEPTDVVQSNGDGSVETSSMESPRVDPFASPGSLAIHSMWDNFSVDRYSTLNSTDVKDSPKRGKKEWTPKITVPQPFAMTIRESETPRKKSRSLKLAEEERLRKAAEEEVEMMKKFRASPVPASTFLPLYELVNAKNEQRREEVKRLSKDLLKATERPFSFTKRERELKQMKTKQKALLKQIEENEQKSNRFRAKPVPKHLFSSEINELIREQEEYRKIRIQMRSEELLASSKLPGSMQLRSQRVRRVEPEHDEDKEYLFQPNINGTVPDYDQAYYEFQKRLAAKKRTKSTTATEPFFLHTDQIPSRKQQIVEDMHRDSQVLPEDRWPFIGPRAKVSRKSPKHTRSKTAQSTYPAQMTQTALLRQSLTQEKLASVLQTELNEQDQAVERKRRERELKRSVVEKSLSTDPTSWLEEKKRQKLQEFQKLDRERQQKYQQQLGEMQERVQSRPLLLEQESLLSQRRSAELKYRATLKKAGLSDKEIEALEQQQ